MSESGSEQSGGKPRRQVNADAPTPQCWCCEQAEKSGHQFSDGLGEGNVYRASTDKFAKPVVNKYYSSIGDKFNGADMLARPVAVSDEERVVVKIGFKEEERKPRDLQESTSRSADANMLVRDRNCPTALQKLDEALVYLAPHEDPTEFDPKYCERKNRSSDDVLKQIRDDKWKEYMKTFEPAKKISALQINLEAASLWTRKANCCLHLKQYDDALECARIAIYGYDEEDSTAYE